MGYVSGAHHPVLLEEQHNHVLLDNINQERKMKWKLPYGVMGGGSYNYVPCGVPSTIRTPNSWSAPRRDIQGSEL